tara:strand:+ start:905 stop:1087 length:183 start_codon:yes stop_codon:yes gene_type:complete
MNIIFWYTVFFASSTSYVALNKGFNPYKWLIVGAVTGIVGLIIISIERKRDNASDNPSAI